MMKIQHPLPAPTPAEIELAKTDADARKRVRNQMLRVKRREEEIGAAACPAPAAAVTQTTLPQTPHTAAAEAAAVEANPTCGQDALKVVMALVKQSEAGSKRGRGATIPKLEAATYAVSICDWGRVGLAEHVTVMRKFFGHGLVRAAARQPVAHPGPENLQQQQERQADIFLKGSVMTQFSFFCCA